MEKYKLIFEARCTYEWKFDLLLVFQNLAPSSFGEYEN
jgi:hypothetical protein